MERNGYLAALSVHAHQLLLGTVLMTRYYCTPTRWYPRQQLNRFVLGTLPAELVLPIMEAIESLLDLIALLKSSKYLRDVLLVSLRVAKLTCIPKESLYYTLAVISISAGS